MIRITGASVTVICFIATIIICFVAHQGDRVNGTALIGQCCNRRLFNTKKNSLNHLDTNQGAGRGARRKKVKHDHEHGQGSTRNNRPHTRSHPKHRHRRKGRDPRDRETGKGIRGSSTMSDLGSSKNRPHQQIVFPSEAIHDTHSIPPTSLQTPPPADKTFTEKMETAQPAINDGSTGPIFELSQTHPAEPGGTKTHSQLPTTTPSLFPSTESPTLTLSVSNHPSPAPPLSPESFGLSPANESPPPSTAFSPSISSQPTSLGRGQKSQTPTFYVGVPAIPLPPQKADEYGGSSYPTSDDSLSGAPTSPILTASTQKPPIPSSSPTPSLIIEIPSSSRPTTLLPEMSPEPSSVSLPPTMALFWSSNESVPSPTLLSSHPNQDMPTSIPYPTSIPTLQEKVPPMPTTSESSTTRSVLVYRKLAVIVTGFMAMISITVALILLKSGRIKVSIERSFDHAVEKKILTDLDSFKNGDLVADVSTTLPSHGFENLEAPMKTNKANGSITTGEGELCAQYWTARLATYTSNSPSSKQITLVLDALGGMVTKF